MRFLKRRIFGKSGCPETQNILAKSDFVETTPEALNNLTESTEAASEISQSSPIRKNSKAKTKKSKPTTKNLIKNFGKAMCNFACSELSKPYRKSLFTDEKLKYQSFKTYLMQRKEYIESIDSFKTLYLINDDDDRETQGFKKAFQALSLIFLKYFAVNWIYQSKVNHKLDHVKVRFKLIRRIKNPQYFTYLKDFKP